MKAFPRFALCLVAAVGVALASASRIAAQTYALDPMSFSLPGIPATSADLLIPGAAPAPGPVPAPMVGMGMATLGLLPGDVIDAFMIADDGPPRFDALLHRDARQYRAGCWTVPAGRLHRGDTAAGGRPAASVG